MNKKPKNKVMFFVVLIVLIFPFVLLNSVQTSRVSGKLSSYNELRSEDIQNIAETNDTKEIARDSIEINNNEIYLEIEKINKQNNYTANKVVQSIEEEEDYVPKQKVTINKTIISFDNVVNKEKETDINIIKLNEGEYEIFKDIQE